MSGTVTVWGGADSIAVEAEQLIGFASALDGAAGSVAAGLRLVTRCLSDPALIGAGLLDPAGGAEVLALAGVAMALAGAALAGCESLSAGLRTAAAAYREGDQLDRRVVPVLLAGYRLPLALAALAGKPGSWSPSSAQAALTADPGLVDAAVQLLSVAATGSRSLPGATVRLADVLATPFRDGTAVVTAQPAMPTDDASGPPRTSADLLRGLALRDLNDDGGGAVDVRILGGAGGRRVIVDITGTTVWNLDPRRRTPQASDFGTNLRTLANESSVFERGVIEALRRAGVRRGEPIMLVGHSQGGMIAARLAADLGAGTEFTVTHLVTAGSPVGLAAVPDSVSVLSMQNRGDVVPELDGADNPRRANWVTVQTDHGDGSVLAKHSLQSYLAGAVDLDRSADPALLRWRAGARRYFTAEAVGTQVFQIRRAD